MQAVFPRIKCEPEKRKKEFYKRELTNIIKENRCRDNARRERDKRVAEQERAVFNEIAERLVREEKQE